MHALETYRKFVTLSNRNEVFIRLLNGQDRSALIKFFQQAPQEDVQFCKQDLKNPMVIDAWINHQNDNKPLT